MATVRVLSVAKRIDASAPQDTGWLSLRAKHKSGFKKRRVGRVQWRQLTPRRPHEHAVAAGGGEGAARRSRGAAGGAAFNRSHHTAYEPYTTHPHAPEPRNEGSPTPRFGPASRSRDGEGEVHTDSNHSTTMARSLGSSMARGLGILLIMMTLSEIAATRARPAYTTKGCSRPHRDVPRAPPPPSKRAPLAAAGRGDHGNERGQRRRGDSRDAPPHLTYENAGSEFNEDDWTFYIVAAGICAFFAAFGIGANDVANAYATSVGSKAITVRQAVMLAAVFEFAGAVLMGSNVAKTIRKGIADASCFEDNPGLMIYGMTCVIISVAIWLILASYFELPVSTTHSCVGGVIGMALMTRGSRCVIWNYTRNDYGNGTTNMAFENFPWLDGVAEIVASWFLSPIASGICAAILYGIVKFAVMRGDACDLGVPRCGGAFTPSTRLVSIRRGRGWFLFRV